MNRFFFLGLALSTSALAQTAVPSFELERLRLNPGAVDGLVVGGADVLPRHGYRVSLTGHYEHDPLVFRAPDGTKLATVVGSRFTTHLAGAWAPLEWLELGLQLPIVITQGGSTQLSDIDVSSPQTTALGTPYLQARYSLLRETAGNPIDLAFGLAVGLPIGSAAALTRDPTVSALPTVGVGRVLGSFRLGGELGATIRGAQSLSPDDLTARDAVGSQFDVGLVAATRGDGLRGELSFRAALPFTNAPPAAEVMVGARYPFAEFFEVYALLGTGFGRLPGTPVFRGLLGLSWGSGRAKPMCDGRPQQPGQCPDPDLDGDGVVDASDQCPTVPGLAAFNGCPDTDGDGVVDASDECPTVKGLVALKGCPDTDGDGLKDSVDKCPTEPGPVERAGCPARDGDRDGVLDEVDACPTVPGLAERKGCPVVDTDADGVPDEIDNCPKVPGVPENQGCPKEQEQLVVITREKLVIKDKVYFDTGKSKIQARSFGMLKQIARILVEHPDVERVVIEGHTDSQGSAALNRKLSQGRADAVKTFLVEQDVQASRLEAKGYGPDRPVAENKSAAGREKNRRVEFVIATPEKVQSKTNEAL
jgi:OOP family OmpA-OmpF porin